MRWDKISSIAIIGASDTPGSPGAVITQNALKSSVEHIFLINPHHQLLFSRRCFEHISQIPEQVELAIIAVPAPVVIEAIKECIIQSITQFVIISAGFAEEHSSYSDELTILIETHSLTVLGPNSLGFISSSQNLNATFAELPFSTGTISILSQSGAVIVALTQYLAMQNLGIEYCFSLGNEQGLTECDLLESLKTSKSRTIFLYLESISDGQRFIRICSELHTKNISVIVLKGGVSSAGQSAAASHTAAMATSERLFLAVCRAAHITMVSSIEQAFETVCQYNRNETLKPIDTAIITNAGGLGTVATDILSGQGIPFSPHTPYFKNPMDVRGDADSEAYWNAITAAHQAGFTQILVIYTMQGRTTPDDILALCNRAKTEFPHLNLFFYTAGGDKVNLLKSSLRIADIKVLDSLLVASPTPVAFSDSRNTNTPISDTQLSEEEVYHIVSNLKLKGISYPKKQFFSANDTPITDIFPAVLKLTIPVLLHKSDTHVVFTNLHTQSDLSTVRIKLNNIIKQSYPQFIHSYEFSVEQQISIDHELFLGIIRDATLGDFAVIGLGGIYANLLPEPLIIPLNISLVDFMVVAQNSLIGQLAGGFRGATCFSLTHLHLLLTYFATYLADHPQTTSIDCNPIIVSGGVLYLADVKILKKNTLAGSLD